MKITPEKVIPWGRNFEEYRRMFALSDTELRGKLLSVGDGPAAFNAHMHQMGHSVISVDPIYALSCEAIHQRISEVKDNLLQQVALHQDQYVWKQIRNVNELERARMQAMQGFLEDFEAGLLEGRYLAHALPEQLPFADKAFDLVLSSHFLLLYADLGFDFHEQCIREMLRVGKEVRIFPVSSRDQQGHRLLKKLMNAFEIDYHVVFREVNYEFQRGANKMMILKSTI
jgi:hypothetical protein